MKRLLSLLLLIVFACQEQVPAPSGLLSKDKMAAVMADFAIYSDAYNIDRNVNMDDIGHYILQHEDITVKQFSDSYQYYLVRAGRLNDIYERAKKIILKKDPALKEFLNKRNQETVLPLSK